MQGRNSKSRKLLSLEESKQLKYKIKMVFKNKKGQGIHYTIVAIILALASLFILGYGIDKFIDAADEAKFENSCRESVQWRLSTQLQVGNADINLVPLVCKTIEKKVTEPDREVVIGQFADDIAKCWWMFNEARQDELLKTAGNVKDMLGWEDNTNRCFMCYVELVEEESFTGFPEGYSQTPETSDFKGMITQNELFDYMESTPYPERKNLTYLNYIQNSGGPGSLVIMEPIIPGNAYAIMFMSKQDDDAGWTAADTTAAGLVSAGAAICFASWGVGCVVASVAGGGYLLFHGINVGQAKILEAKREFYESPNRDVSIVVLDDLESANQAQCSIGDIAGR